MNQVQGCRCEPLELRRHFSSIHLAHNGLLTIIGAAGSANTITVELTPDQQSIDVAITYAPNKKTTKNIDGTYLLTDVSSLRIVGGSKADYIAVGQTDGSITLPDTILGKAGNDTIYGGDGPNYVLSGPGHDYIVGGAGNDTLIGQGRYDTLLGGAGDDMLRGKGNYNDLEGGDGNDTLYDSVGPDTMLGGAGNNTFNVTRLKTDPDNDYNSTDDKLHIIPPASDDSSFWDDVLDYYVL